jgi:hypothetical protein
VGGDANATKYGGRYLFADFYIHKRPEDSEKLPLSGALYNLMLDMLAPSGADIQTRWRLVLSQLAQAASEAGLNDIPALTGDPQLMYATAFVSLLGKQAYRVVGKTYTPKQREGSDFKPKVTLGSIEAMTPDVMAKRKVSVFETDVDTAF